MKQCDKFNKSHLLKLSSGVGLIIIIIISMYFEDAINLIKKQKTRTSSDDLIVAISATPSNINPFHATDAYSQNTDSLIFNALVKLSNNFTPENDLAESIEITNLTEYKIKIKENVYFHDGSKLEAADVVESIKQYQDPKVSSPFRESFQRILKAEAIDKFTLVFRTKKAEPDLLSDLILLKILPLSKMSVQEFDKKLIGTGPYKFVSINHSSVKLQKHERYFSKPGKIKNIELKIVKDDITRYLKLIREEVDIIMNGLSPPKVHLLENEKDIKVITAPGANYSYIAFNLKNKFFRNSKFRKAVAHALDIPKIINYKHRNMARQANSVYSPEFYFHYKAPIYDFNPELSEKYLDELGLKRSGEDNMRPIEFTWKTTTNKFVLTYTRIMVEMLKKVGIKVKIRIFEWGTFYGDVKKGNFEVYSLRWIGHTGPEFLYDLFHSVENVPEGFHRPRFNRVGYSNQEVDQLLREGMSISDMEKRKKILDKAQRLIAEDMPYISLWHSDVTAAFTKRLKNVTLTPSGSWKTLADIQKLR